MFPEQVSKVIGSEITEYFNQPKFIMSHDCYKTHGSRRLNRVSARMYNILFLRGLLEHSGIVTDLEEIASIQNMNFPKLEANYGASLKSLADDPKELEKYLKMVWNYTSDSPGTQGLLGRYNDGVHEKILDAIEESTGKRPKVCRINSGTGVQGLPAAAVSLNGLAESPEWRDALNAAMNGTSAQDINNQMFEVGIGVAVENGDPWQVPFIYGTYANLESIFIK